MTGKKHFEGNLQRAVGWCETEVSEMYTGPRASALNRSDHGDFAGIVIQ